MAGVFRFSFGPWNIHEGADPFGPPVRRPVELGRKLKEYRRLGFEGVQFHDDDAVPDLNNLSARQIEQEAKTLAHLLQEEGLVAEFVAPRLWEDYRTIDGAYTSNDEKCRQYALERSFRAIDIARALGTNLIVLWLAREGTYIRESKDTRVAIDRLVEAINAQLNYDNSIRIAIEPKPNEPMDQAFIPTAGHALAVASRCLDPGRVGVNVESAHAILAGLDPAEEMAFALSFGKLFSVHLNDQNGLKFDQDKVFGSVDIRRAFNQVRVLDRYGYGTNGEWVGLDVKAMRTQPEEKATKHLKNSRAMFLSLLEISRNLDEERISGLIKERDYEELEGYILQRLIGR